jgi:hypothetical protein
MKKRKKIVYKYIVRSTLTVVVPTCKLKSQMFIKKGEAWRDYKAKCFELLAILKAWQLQQSNGFGSFKVDESVLTSYFENWKKYLFDLIQVGIIVVNPYNNKLDFDINQSVYQELYAKSNARIPQLKTILLNIDHKRYSILFKVSNQKYFAKNNTFLEQFIAV